MKRCHHRGAPQNGWESATFTAVIQGAHVGKILLKIITRRLSDYLGIVGTVPEDRNGFRPNRSTTDMRSFTENGVEEINSVVRAHQQSHQSVLVRRSNTPVESTRPFRRITEDDFGYSTIPRWHAGMRVVPRRQVLGMVPRGTRSASRGWVRAPHLNHLRGGDTRSLHTFRGGYRYFGRLGEPPTEIRVGRTLRING